VLQRGHSFSPSIGRNILDAPLSSSSTALKVWWFGGTESSEMNQDSDSCELVAVRIEKTSVNSRKIAGDITVPRPLSDVWAILSDYDRLATHVPNLVESRIVYAPPRGEPGDGSYRCKLFQKGAQKIVGFEFGASLTMEMTEQIVSAEEAREERKIGFRCVDSFFFSGFDGEWRGREQISPEGQVETVLNYEVDVRPKGPVPVAALEWRIREDVPTNLRAVKKAAVEVGQEGVLAYRQQGASNISPSTPPRAVAQTAATSGIGNGNVSPRETNAIKRATVRRRNGATKDTLSVAARNSANALSSTRGSRNNIIPQPAPPRNAWSAGTNGRRRTNDVDNSNGRRQPEAAQPGQPSKNLPLPVKVNWDTDETMAAYLRKE
jgi:hypothetical protein